MSSKGALRRGALMLLFDARLDLVLLRRMTLASVGQDNKKWIEVGKSF
jgi:hypothetical protein